MNFKSLLQEKQTSIVDKWCDLTRQTYPEQSQDFFKRKDQFGNPVGHIISEGIACLFDALLKGEESSEAYQALDGIVRLRAIQEFSPSEAVSFVFGLKSVIREELGTRILKNGTSDEWAAFDARIDGLALLGFDIYSKCRQQISDIRVDAVRRRSDKLLKMAGLTYEVPEFEPELEADLKEEE